MRRNVPFYLSQSLSLGWWDYILWTLQINLQLCWFLSLSTHLSITLPRSLLQSLDHHLLTSDFLNILFLAVSLPNLLTNVPFFTITPHSNDAHFLYYSPSPFPHCFYLSSSLFSPLSVATLYLRHLPLCPSFPPSIPVAAPSIFLPSSFTLWVKLTGEPRDENCFSKRLWGRSITAIKANKGEYWIARTYYHTNVSTLISMYNITTLPLSTCTTQCMQYTAHSK